MDKQEKIGISNKNLTFYLDGSITEKTYLTKEQIKLYDR